MKLQNTLTKKKEEFIPIDEKNVRMYVCGPTVYDRAHIGNARAVVVFDVLFRVLQQQYGVEHVTYARNITDVDDKINLRAKESALSISEITEKTIQQFTDDMGALGCFPPNIEPRATEHIDEMQTMIAQLIENGHAYEAEGHVLFNVASDSNYGHLSRRSRDEMIAGARVEIAPYKKNPADFVLWKPSNAEKGEPGWESPWGFGRPGWHIECSAMSTEYLGDTFDIHGGGADLQFPHHENEIAQSNCANKGGKFAKYWVHNGFLTVEGEKMSKSLGNFITVHDLLEQGVKGEVIRLALLSTHYRKPLDWSEKGLQDATKMLDFIYSAFIEENANDVHDYSENHAKEVLFSSFINFLHDDLNTPAAIMQLRQLAIMALGTSGKIRAEAIKELTKAGALLGLLQHSSEEWLKKEKVADNQKEKIESLITARLEAKQAKNWAEADRIRDELTAMGITLKDNKDGTTSWE